MDDYKSKFYDELLELALDNADKAITKSDTDGKDELDIITINKGDLRILLTEIMYYRSTFGR